jgi:hypothetical protein
MPTEDEGVKNGGNAEGGRSGSPNWRLKPAIRLAAAEITLRRKNSRSRRDEYSKNKRARAN